MNLTEAFVSRQKEIRGASLRGFMQTGNSDQLLLLFEKGDQLIGLNITERKNGDNVSVSTDIDLCQMIGDSELY
ncbi:MAG: hypothetical protein KAT58_00300 [candidate division Zixibacteria bacterium]|nr:hypothetical protein [candidate division Zixibacteria bacterium]